MNESRMSPEAMGLTPSESEQAYSQEAAVEDILRELDVEDDDVLHDEAEHELSREVKQAADFLYAEKGRNHTLSAYEFTQLKALAERIHEVNQLEWKRVEGGEHYKAKRPDGSEVSVPSSYFPDHTDSIKLSNMIVNTEGGYTILDALDAIIGKEHSNG